MRNEQNDVDAKVLSIFGELAADKGHRLAGSRPASEAVATIAEALAGHYPLQVAADIAFHLSDWNSDAAFVVALHLFPERFTKEEVASGVTSLLIHAPNHLAAAAKLAGYPIEDVFGLGTLTEDRDA